MIGRNPAPPPDPWESENLHTADAKSCALPHARAVNELQDGRPQRGCWRDIDPAVVENQAIHHRPGLRLGVPTDGIAELGERRVAIDLLAHLIKQGELRPRDCHGVPQVLVAM